MKTVVTSGNVGTNGSSTWSGLLQADEVFSRDLYLVNASATPMVSPLVLPPPVGTYALTSFAKINEPALLQHFGRSKVVVVVGCMDKRFAYPLYKWAVKTNLRYSWITGRRILPIFVAGGIAQDGDPDRLRAMKDILQYTLQNLNVVKIITAGHSSGCGGVAHIRFRGQQPVYQALKCEPGDKKEDDFIKGVINVSVNQILTGEQQKIVQKVLVVQKGRGVDFVTFR